MEGILTIIIALLVITREVKKHRHKMKTLSTSQITAIAVTYIIALAVATFMIYFVGNWIAGWFMTPFIQSSIFILIVILTLGFVIWSSTLIVESITNRNRSSTTKI